MGKHDKQPNALSEREHVAWIFQGNPDLYKIDEYLASYPEWIYWSANRYISEIKIGDRTFIWRAGKDSGLIASGKIVEEPMEETGVKFPKALGKELWIGQEGESRHDKHVGIIPDSIRLLPEDGMISRSIIKADPVLGKNHIITVPQGRVFSLSYVELNRLEELWRNCQIDAGSPDIDPTDTEGTKRLCAHWRRERSRFLGKLKKEEFRQIHGALHCEVCALSEKTPYPAEFGSRIFEVHHISPLAEAQGPQKTKLSDLALVCANCHRAIHATKEVEQNMLRLKKLLAK
jgi:hypothetical protein